MGRVIIIGLDGGTWRVIEPLAREGLLPTFGSLMKKGAWGTLKSTYPPISCPAWFSFATGADPGMLGMYDFWTLDRHEYRVRYHTYAEVGYPDFWDILGENGFSCGIVNDPMVYAKRRINGYVVPGFAVPLPSFSPFPACLKDELDKATGGYELDLYGHYLIEDRRLFESGLRVMGKRWKAFAYLLDRYPTDLFLGVITETDRIFHRFFQDLQEGGREGDPVRRKMLVDFMVELDQGMAGILELLRPDDLFMIMSDHGFEEKSEAFHVNQFLQDAGFLAFNKSLPSGRINLSQRGMASMLSRIGLMDFAKKHVPRGLIKLFPMGPLRERDFLLNDLIDMGKVDWDRTKVIYLDGFHVNTSDRPQGRVPRRDVPALMKELTELVEDIYRKDAAPSSPHFINPRERYWSGAAVDAPALMLDFDGPVYVSSSLKKGRPLRESPVLPHHHSDGIFLVMHPSIEPGRVEKDVSLLDLAPMILQLFGLPRGAAMQGNVPSSLLRPDGSLRMERPAKKTSTHLTRLEKERIRKKAEELRRRERRGPA